MRSTRIPTPGNAMSGDSAYGDRENSVRYRNTGRDEHRRFGSQLESDDAGGHPFKDRWTEHDEVNEDLTDDTYIPGRRSATQDGHAYATRRDTPTAEQLYRDSDQQRGDHRGRGPKQARTDQRIYEEVCERLSEHDRIDASEIQVAVENGEVTLSGRLRSRNQKRLATDVADRVHGVRDVHNSIRLEDEQRWPPEPRE